MGNASPVAVEGLGCAACHCDEGKKCNEMCLAENRDKTGVYPHALYQNGGEDCFDLYDGPQPSSVDIMQAQAVVKNFVRSLVQGLPVTLLSVNGGTAACRAFLDVELTTLTLQRKGVDELKTRAVPLSEITEVNVGESGGRDFKLQTDSLCVTMHLDSGKALGFRFQDEEERDTFALCFSMFIDARRLEGVPEDELAAYAMASARRV